MSKGRVLVVDDDALLRDFLKNRLIGEGFEVHAITGQVPETIRVLQGRYDLVLNNLGRPVSLEKLNKRLNSLDQRQTGSTTTPT